jgi:hypothetical protein
MFIGEDRLEAVDETLVPERSSVRDLPLRVTNAVHVGWDRAVGGRGVGVAEANGCYSSRGLLPSARCLRATHRRTEA